MAAALLLLAVSALAPHCAASHPLPRLSHARAPTSLTSSPPLMTTRDAAAAGRAENLMAVGAALSSLLQGYNTGVIGGALLSIVPEFDLAARPAVQGLIVTATTLGSLAGTISASRLSDSLGRRGTMLVSSALFAVAGALLSWAPTAAILVLARLVAGLAIGNAGAVVPVYIAECSRKSSRGRLSTIPQLFISSGILCSYAVAFAVSVLAPRGGWRLMMSVTLVLAVVQLACVLALPESPRFLLSKGKDDEARLALARLRGVASRPDVTNVEFAEMREGIKRDAHAPSFSESWAVLREPAVRRTLLVCVALQMLQQFSGINAIVYYTPQTLQEVGVPLLFSRLGFTADAASMLATTLAYIPKIPSLLLTMVLIDRVGRRKLLQSFVPLLGLCHLALVWAFSAMSDAAVLPKVVAVLGITVYGCAFALSLGPIPNILTAELFPMRARSMAMSTSLGSQFLFNTMVGMGFPILRHAFGTRAVFGMFAIVCFAATIFVSKFVPETKGEALERISEK
ncbi:hypothetical protein AB1Y20_014894 [Prymnesium parvum]|uniref:Major facilitator superfamily (MFS) profile domain-containing protein n=1 Tax=Prymnesium parvum TaxID=97485 RepID=A0AB34JZ35_PRYPA